MRAIVRTDQHIDIQDLAAPHSSPFLRPQADIDQVPSESPFPGERSLKKLWEVAQCLSQGCPQTAPSAPPPPNSGVTRLERAPHPSLFPTPPAVHRAVLHGGTQHSYGQGHTEQVCTWQCGGAQRSGTRRYCAGGFGKELHGQQRTGRQEDAIRGCREVYKAVNPPSKNKTKFLSLVQLVVVSGVGEK